MHTFNTDTALNQLGVWGRYQVFLGILGNFLWIPCGVQMMCTAFSHIELPFACVQSSDASANGDGGLRPFADHHYNSSCELPLDNGTELKCGVDNRTSFVFDLHRNESAKGHTMPSEFVLVCDQAYLIDLAGSSLFFGFMIGSVVIPAVADRFGRRKPILFSILLLIAASFGAALSPSYAVYFLLRALTGFAVAGLGITGHVLACESVALPLRHFAPLAMATFWVTGYCGAGLLAMCLPSWRTYTLACACTSLILLPYFYLTPESVHWLAATGNIDAATKWLQHAAKINKTRIDLSQCLEPMTETEKFEQESQKKYNVLDIFTNPVLLAQTIFMAYLWACNTFVYYGLSLFSTSLAGDKYLNYMLSGIVELPSAVMVVVLLRVAGRRFVMFFFHLVAGLSLLVLIFLQPGTALSTCVWLLGKFCIISTFNSVWLYGAELFPTVVRSAGVGVCNVAARAGGILAPFVRTMAAFDASLPSLVFGCSSLLASTLVVFLPETNGRNLPDDLDQIDPGPVFSRCVANKRNVAADNETD